MQPYRTGASALRPRPAPRWRDRRLAQHRHRVRPGPDDHQRALDAFQAALKLARGSSNPRGEVQALLYRGETLRRMGRLDAAAGDLQTALDGAIRVGLVEEQWKALYSLGRVVEAQGRRDDARRSFERAIAAIESVRADLQAIALKSEFLADKRDVYDALIALRLSDPSASAATCSSSSSKAARAPGRIVSSQALSESRLATCSRRLPQARCSSNTGARGRPRRCSGFPHSASGVVRQASSLDDITSIQRLGEAVSRDGDDWRAASAAAGRILLSGLPDLTGVTRLLVVPDGPLHDIPFEALTVPDAQDLLVERLDISYLPSAAFLVHRARNQTGRGQWPWQRTLVAFGDPPPVSAATSPGGVALPRLSYADEEIRGIAELLPGRPVLHMGEGAQKRFLHQELPRRRCCTSAPTRSATRAIRRGRASCSRRPRR